MPINLIAGIISYMYVCQIITLYTLNLCIFVKYTSVNLGKKHLFLHSLLVTQMVRRKTTWYALYFVFLCK